MNKQNELNYLQIELSKAIEIAIETHHQQRDKAGELYIYHPFNVMMNIKNEDKIFELKCKIVAMLHDVLEDTKDISATESLLNTYIDSELIECIRLLTKEKKGYNEKEYFKRIKENPIARTVKIADLTHNMDLSRLKEVTVKDKNRYRKYKYWKEYLLDEEDRLK